MSIQLASNEEANDPVWGSILLEVIVIEASAPGLRVRPLKNSHF